MPKASQDFELFEPTVVIDSNEGAPYQFTGIRSSGKPLVIRTERRALWRDGLADYTLAGHELGIQIERKSVADLFATLGSRRDRFEAEIARLHERVEFSAVVVEGTEADVITWRGNGPLPKSVLGTIDAWEQRYHRVRWWLCCGRAAAEAKTFRALRRFWIEQQKKGRK